MSRKILLSAPVLNGNEWKYLKECLDTGWVSSAGPFVDRFENEIARYLNVPYAVACVNGTAALQVALQVAGVQPETEVIVPTVTFIAAVNAVRYLSALPVFMDCDNCYNIDAEKTIRFIQEETVFKNGNTFNRATQQKITAMVPVHVFGNAADLEKLLDLCRERNIKIIEDATESLGSFYTQGKIKGKHCAAAGDIGCLSFNGNKIITSGGGGMIVTHNKQYALKAKYLTTQAKDDEVFYRHDEVGYNFRLTNIQAALGLAQLEQLPKILEAKKANFRKYQQRTGKLSGLRIADVPAYADNNCWMYALQIDEKITEKKFSDIMKYLESSGIQTRPLWQLNHLQKPYEKCQSYQIDKALSLYERTLNLPCSANLTENEIDFVIEKIKECLSLSTTGAVR